jgi:hypothetical protein
MKLTRLPKIGGLLALILSFYGVPTGDPITMMVVAAITVPLVYFLLRTIIHRSNSKQWPAWKALAAAIGTSVLTVYVTLLVLFWRHI